MDTSSAQGEDFASSEGRVDRDVTVTTSYALYNLKEAGTLFAGPGIAVSKDDHWRETRRTRISTSNIVREKK